MSSVFDWGRGRLLRRISGFRSNSQRTWNGSAPCVVYVAHYFLVTMQLDQNLENVLSKILGKVSGQTQSIDEALARQFNILRSDAQSDINFRLDSKALEIVVRLEKLVRASLETTTIPGDGLRETERAILHSLARNVAFLL